MDAAQVPRGSAASRRAKPVTNEGLAMNPFQNYFMGKGCSAGAARSEFVRFRATDEWSGGLAAAWEGKAQVVVQLLAGVGEKEKRAKLQE